MFECKIEGCNNTVQQKGFICLRCLDEMDALGMHVDEDVVEKRFKEAIVDEESLDMANWDFQGLPDGFNTHKVLSIDEKERERYLFGEWVMKPLNALVLYSKGNRGNIKHLFGKDFVHYVNTTYSNVADTAQGHRYKEIIIFDDGVKQSDIDVAMKYKWEK